MKVDLIIDTNSFSHLSIVEINRDKPSTWLWKYFNVKTSFVIRNEFGHNIQKAPANSKGINRKLDNKSFILNTTKFEVIQSNWLIQYYYKKTLAAEDLGERHLICS